MIKQKEIHHQHKSKYQMRTVSILILVALSTLLIGVSMNRSYIYTYIGLNIASRVWKIDYDKLKYALRTESKDILIIDVRPAYEFNQGHLYGDVSNIPLYENAQEKWKTQVNTDSVIKQIQELRKGKRLVVVYGDFAQDAIVEELVLQMNLQMIPTRILNLGWKEWSAYYGVGQNNGVSPVFNTPVLPIPKP